MGKMEQGPVPPAMVSDQRFTAPVAEALPHPTHALVDAAYHRMHRGHRMMRSRIVGFSHQGWWRRDAPARARWRATCAPVHGRIVPLPHPSHIPPVDAGLRTQHVRHDAAWRQAKRLIEMRSSAVARQHNSSSCAAAKRRAAGGVAPLIRYP